MRTSLSTYAQERYPLDYERDKSRVMRRLQKRCQRGEIKATKEGKLWMVLNDGAVKKKAKDNPLI